MNVWVQKISNKRGIVSKIMKLEGNERKQNIVIPYAENKEGCKFAVRMIKEHYCFEALEVKDSPTNSIKQMIKHPFTEVETS